MPGATPVKQEKDAIALLLGLSSPKAASEDDSDVTSTIRSPEQKRRFRLKAQGKFDPHIVHNSAPSSYEQVSTFFCNQYLVELAKMAGFLELLFKQVPPQLVQVGVAAFFERVFRVVLPPLELLKISPNPKAVLLHHTMCRALLTHASEDIRSLRFNQVNPRHLYVFCRNYNQWCASLGIQIPAHCRSLVPAWFQRHSAQIIFDGATSDSSQTLEHEGFVPSPALQRLEQLRSTSHDEHGHYHLRSPHCLPPHTHTTPTPRFVSSAGLTTSPSEFDSMPPPQPPSSPLLPSLDGLVLPLRWLGHEATLGASPTPLSGQPTRKHGNSNNNVLAERVPTSCNQETTVQAG